MSPREKCIHKVGNEQLSNWYRIIIDGKTSAIVLYEFLNCSWIELFYKCIHYPNAYDEE